MQQNCLEAQVEQPPTPPRSALPGCSFELTKGTDLCSRRTKHRDARDGKVVGAVIQPPCISWSIARQNPHVRSVEEPQGYKQQLKILTNDHYTLKVGNATMRAGLLYIQVLVRFKILFIFEHTLASRFWLDKNMKTCSLSQALLVSSSINASMAPHGASQPGWCCSVSMDRTPNASKRNARDDGDSALARKKETFHSLLWSLSASRAGIPSPPQLCFGFLSH